MKGVVAIFALLLLVSGAGAQNTFVLPWVETPPGIKTKVTAGNSGDSAASAGQLPPRTRAAKIQQVGGTQKSDFEEGGIQLTPPTPERMFRFESEEKLRQRIRDEVKNIKVEFPPTDEAAPVVHTAPRIWPFLVVTAEPGVVCYKRLWFEQKNSERYGWDLGVLQPLVSAGVFYTDLALLPLHWVTDPCRWYDCSAGQCLPGDPVPFLWHPILSK